MQVIVMTSDKTNDKLNGFFHQWNKYIDDHSLFNIVVCGFERPKETFYTPIKTSFYSIGNMLAYPQNKWTDAFINVLDNVADEVFLFMMDDFWLVRGVNTQALEYMYDYMRQFRYVLKMDVVFERLYSGTPPAPEGYTVYRCNQFYWGHNNYDTLDYLDLIKSDPASAYHMSLWGGFFNRDLLKKIVIPRQTAQELEMDGTHRLQEYNNDMLVLGTRQGPLKHANVQQGGKWNEDANAGLPALKENDRKELQKLGYI